MSAPPAAPPSPTRRRPPPDPRLTARRVAVARAAGRRRLLVGAAVLATCLVVAGVIFALHSALFAARSITVTGAVHETRAEVVAAGDLRGTPPLIDVSTGRAAAAIERLAWVRTATVSRRWPSSLSITITERTPLATVTVAKGDVAVLDPSGRVLEDVAAAPSGLAPLAGIAAVPPPGESLPESDRPLLEVASGLPVAALGKVAAIERRVNDGLVIVLSHGPLVILGTTSQVPEKMTALMTLLDRASLVGIAAIDLRVPGSPVLTPQSRS